MSDIEEPAEGRGISRRTVTKAMAWSVPVIAVAAAAPVASASQGVLTLTGGGCKLPGNSEDTYKGNVFKMSAQNTFTVPITVDLTSVTLRGENLGSFVVINLDNCTAAPNPATLQPGASFPNLALLTADAPNSNNGQIVLSYTLTVQGNPTPQTATAVALAVPPVQGGSCIAFTSTEKTCIETHV